MNKPRVVVCVSLLASLGLALLGISGCKKHPAPAANTDTGPILSAEQTSFDAVTSKLDKGGNLYLYLGTEQWMNGISGKIDGLRGIAGGIPNQSEQDRTNIDSIFDLVTQTVKDSGLEDVSGVGMSSIAIDPGLYHSKMVLHHYAGSGGGFLWNACGATAHPLAGLDLLPATTAFALFSDGDVKLLWSAAQKEVKQSKLDGAKNFMDTLPDRFEKSTGMKWNTLLSSFGGEFGFVVTLNDANPIKVPLPTADPLEIPEPGMMLVIKVNDDAIYNRLEKAMLDGQMHPSKVEESNLKMRILVAPLPLPMRLTPTMASSGGYLLFATSDKLIRTALDVRDGKQPGLKSTDEFKRLSKAVPEEGNQFCFVSKEFGETVLKIQQQTMAMNRNSPPAVRQWMQSNLVGTSGSSYVVAANTDEGWIMTGNGTRNSSELIAAMTVALPAGLISAIALPNFVKGRHTAQMNACINNLRQIDGAKQQWALEYKKPGDAIPTEADLLPYLRHNRMPVCPGGGTYSINAVNVPPECTEKGHKLPE